MAKSKTTKGHAGLRLARIRQMHVYVSVFVAPSLLFFALTGALQTFRIPDQKTAPVLIQKLARVHKDDVFAVEGHKHGPPPPGPSAAAKPKEIRPPSKNSTTGLKWFFTAVSVGIGLTTVFGLWMALAHSRRKAVLWAILAAGIAAPVLLLAF